MLNQHQTVKNNIAKFNKLNPLVDYLRPFIQGKREVKIADIASGPFCIIGQLLEGVDLKVWCCDSQDFSDFYKKYNVAPLFTPEYQDMEKLTYPDDFFDLVVCQNSLDHTKDALKAVKEMIRICKPRGYVYIDCCIDQMDTGHKHFWNAKEDGIFTNGTIAFDLKEMGFSIKYIDNGGEIRYNHIIATLKK